MRITRFGDAWGTAYELPLLKAAQPQLKNFRIISAPVSGASGEYDFYGGNQFPVEPKTYEIKGTLTADSYAEITDEITALETALVGVGRSKLWFETRDTAATGLLRWIYAKCVSVSEDGEVAGQYYTDFPVIMTFRCSEGLIYNNIEQGIFETTPFHSRLTQNGTYNFAPINFTIGISAITGSPLIYVSAHVVRGQQSGGGWIWVPHSGIVWSSTREDGPGKGETFYISSDALSIKTVGQSYYADSLGNALVSVVDGTVSWVTALGYVYNPAVFNNYFIEYWSIAGGDVANVNNSTPISINTTQPHGLNTGDPVSLFSTGITDGSFIITVTGLSVFTLNGTLAAGSGVTGRWILGGAISAMTVGTPSTVTTSNNHGLSDGDAIGILGAPADGNKTCNGLWVVQNKTANTFEVGQDTVGLPNAAINPSAYGGSGAFWYPAPKGYGIDVVWNDTWV